MRVHLTEHPITCGSAARKAARPPGRWVASALLVCIAGSGAVLRAQCVFDSIYSLASPITSGTVAYVTDVSSLAASSTIGNSASVTLATGTGAQYGSGVITLLPGFNATAGSAATTFHAFLYSSYPPPCPVLDSVSPNSALAGTPVDIIGENFPSSSGPAPLLYFNGVAAATPEWGEGVLTAAVPANAPPGAGSIYVVAQYTVTTNTATEYITNTSNSLPFTVQATTSYYTIAGNATASGSALAGVTVTLSGGESGTAVTGSNGSYSFAVAGGGNYTVTPSLAYYTFTPASTSFSSVNTNETANFAATPVTYTIGGAVSGSVKAGVTVTLSGSQSQTTSTNSGGSYAFTVNGGGNYTVTPSLAGYTFTPPSTSFSNVGANQTANFTSAVAPTDTIGGTVTAGGIGKSGVTVALSGSSSGATTTNSSGAYSFTVNTGGNYTVTPSLTGYTLSPPSTTFNDVTSNQTANFTATALPTYTITGTVTVAGGSGLPNVTLQLTGTSSGTATTSSSGAYTLTVYSGGNYTVTPSLASYAFTPASAQFNDVTGNTTQNFTAAVGTGMKEYIRVGGRVIAIENTIQ
ncbi:MAG TPA: hypothetical protein VN924_05205 [Bryobacteraceae bacterium]|nr:hypothetical protein [Bryobacteraceae bacterium]